MIDTSNYVDSSQRELELQEIVMIAGAHQGTNGMDAAQYWAAISIEFNVTKCLVIKEGNTLFIVNNTPTKGRAFFRALNADVPQNYLNNCKLFIKAAQMAGYHTLVTQFKDQQLVRLLRLVKNTAQGYFDPSTRLEISQTQDGSYQAVIFMNGSGIDPNSPSPDPEFSVPPSSTFAGAR